MLYYPKMFRVFVTKQVSECTGTNHKAAHWNMDVKDVCPNCGLEQEASKHMMRCKCEARVGSFVRLPGTLLIA